MAVGVAATVSDTNSVLITVSVKMADAADCSLTLMATVSLGTVSTTVGTTEPFVSVIWSAGDAAESMRSERSAVEVMTVVVGGAATSGVDASTTEIWL